MATYFIKLLPRFLENRKKKIIERKRQLIKEREKEANSFTNDLIKKILERYPYVDIDLHAEFDWKTHTINVKISNKGENDKNITELTDKLYMTIFQYIEYFNAVYSGLTLEIYDYAIKFS